MNIEALLVRIIMTLGIILMIVGVIWLGFTLNKAAWESPLPMLFPFAILMDGFVLAGFCVLMDDFRSHK